MLVGMMGAGKSTVGALLAERLGRPFHDSDAEIEARTGHTVADIFDSEGEQAFRAEESAVMLDMLTFAEPSVIAAAGGAVLDPATRQRLAGTMVVWLRADPAVLASRVGDAAHRPLLAHDPVATLERLATEREALYAQVATVTVEVGELDPSQVVDAVLAGTGAPR